MFIVDSYRWLENVKDTKVQEWLKAQNDYTSEFLGKIPERDRILNRIRDLDGKTPARIVGNFKRDGKGNYYYYKMSGSEGLSKGYVRDAIGIERLLIDPEMFTVKGQATPNFGGISPSPDGRYIAFRVGSTERAKLYIMEVKTKRLIGEPVENVLNFSSLGWDSDGKGLYYIRLPRLPADASPTERYLNSSVYRHTVGSNPAEDKLILASGANQGLNLKPTQWAFLDVSSDSKFAVVWVEGDPGGGYALYAAPKEKARTGKAAWWKIADFGDGVVKANVRGNEIFLLIGKDNSSQRKFLRLPIDAKLEDAKLIDLPLSESILTDVNAEADALYVIGREGSSGRLYRVTYDGKAEKIELPFKRDATNPTYLMGYGSYGVSFNPFFDNVFVPWFEAGGIVAVAHVRGGGEYGEEWHKAGSRDKKPNTWKDFIACAEYLIAQKYTSSKRLAGGGASAGGIMIGRAITERPGLFAAGLIMVGTTDMLRAEYQMNGPVNVGAFGTVKNQKDFENLYEMSAYHHVKDGTKYPAVLLTTGMRDTNVDVWQPAKMAARLQAANTSGKPVLLSIDLEGGHDQWGSTRRQLQELRADQLAFLFQQLGISK